MKNFKLGLLGLGMGRCEMLKDFNDWLVASWLVVLAYQIKKCNEFEDFKFELFYR